MVFLVVVGYVNAQVLAVVIQTMEASLRVDFVCFAMCMPLVDPSVPV